VSWLITIKNKIVDMFPLQKQNSIRRNICVYTPLPITKDRHAVFKVWYGRCIDLVLHGLIITKNLGPRAFRTPRWYARVAMKESSNRQPPRYRSSAKPFYLNRRLTSQAGIYAHIPWEKIRGKFQFPLRFYKKPQFTKKKKICVL